MGAEPKRLADSVVGAASCEGAKGVIDIGGYGQRAGTGALPRPLFGSQAARALCSVAEGSLVSKRVGFWSGRWPHTGI